MSNIHPHWKATDNPKVKVSVTEEEFVDTPKQKTELPIAGMTVSRRPAAILGILLVVGVGYFAVENLHSLRGAVSSQIQVDIEERGLRPHTITAEPGQTIVWRNAVFESHAMTSDTLCSPSEGCLSTAAVHLGGTVSYKIPDDIRNGTYHYMSQLDSDISGVIIIRKGGASAAATTNTAVSESARPAATDSPPVPNSVPSVPTNPNRVGTDRTNPAESLHASVTGKGTEKGKGLRQPETGARAWFILFGALAGMYAVSRTSVKKVTSSLEQWNIHH